MSQLQAQCPWWKFLSTLQLRLLNRSFKGVKSYAYERLEAMKQALPEIVGHTESDLAFRLDQKLSANSLLMSKKEVKQVDPASIHDAKSQPTQASNAEGELCKENKKIVTNKINMNKVNNDNVAQNNRQHR